MFSKFFAQDNATAKLSSWLILAAAVGSTISHGLQLSPTVSDIVLVLTGVFTIVAQFFQSNKVIAKSSWFTLAYMVTDYVAHNQTAFPQAKDVLLTLAAVLTLVTNFTNQSVNDPKPPSADPLSK